MIESARASGTDWIGCERIGRVLDLLAADRCADLRNVNDMLGRNMVPK
jgi:hypothetical protein